MKYHLNIQVLSEEIILTFKSFNEARKNYEKYCLIHESVLMDERGEELYSTINKLNK